LASFIAALAQSQPTSFIAARTPAKNSQNAGESIKTLIKKSIKNGQKRLMSSPH